MNTGEFIPKFDLNVRLLIYNLEKCNEKLNEDLSVDFNKTCVCVYTHTYLCYIIGKKKFNIGIKCMQI